MAVGWEIPEGPNGRLNDLLLVYVEAQHIPGNADTIVQHFLEKVHATSNSGVELLSAERDGPTFRLALALSNGLGVATAVVEAVQDVYGMMGRRFEVMIESEGVIQLRMREDSTQTWPTWRDNAMFAAWSKRLDQEFGDLETLQALAAVLVQSDPDSGYLLVSTDPSTTLWGLTALLLKGEPGSAAAEVLHAILDRYRRSRVTLLIGGKRRSLPV